MALKPFSFHAIDGIDLGRIATAFDEELRLCYLDCKNRPGLEKGRTVKLTVTLAPIQADGRLESVDVTFGMDHSIPKRESRKYNMNVGREGMLFNELSPEDADQLTLDDAAGPRPTAPVAKEAADVG